MFAINKCDINKLLIIADLLPVLFIAVGSAFPQKPPGYVENEFVCNDRFS